MHCFSVLRLPSCKKKQGPEALFHYRRMQYLCTNCLSDSEDFVLTCDVAISSLNLNFWWYELIHHRRHHP